MSGGKATALPHTPPLKQLSLFRSGCRLPGACCLSPSDPFHPHASSLAAVCMHAEPESPAGRVSHLLEVLGHFSSTALHRNYHHLASKLCILVSGTCPLKT